METSGVRDYQSLASLIGAQLTDEHMKSLPVDILAFLVAAKQTSGADKKMEESLVVLKQKQADIAEMRAKFAELKELQQKASKGEETKLPAAMAAFLQKYGIKAVKGSGEKLGKEEWDVQSEYLQAKMQEINTALENDMLSVQRLMNRRNEALDLASGIIKRADDSRASLVK